MKCLLLQSLGIHITMEREFSKLNKWSIDCKMFTSEICAPRQLGCTVSWQLSWAFGYFACVQDLVVKNVRFAFFSWLIAAGRKLLAPASCPAAEMQGEPVQSKLRQCMRRHAYQISLLELLLSGQASQHAQARHLADTAKLWPLPQYLLPVLHFGPLSCKALLAAVLLACKHKTSCSAEEHMMLYALSAQEMSRSNPANDATSTPIKRPKQVQLCGKIGDVTDNHIISS